MASIMDQVVKRTPTAVKLVRDAKPAGVPSTPMDRIRQRAAQAIRVRDRRTAKRVQHVKNAQEMMIRKRKEENSREKSKLIVMERARRKDEWERGPLAARHDVGEAAEAHGVLPPQLAYQADEFAARKPNWFHIQIGDRVVVTVGRYTGRIAEVTNLNEDNCHVTLEGISVDMKLPDYMVPLVGGRQIVTREMEIPLNHVKLVWAMIDPKTNRPKDFVIDRLEAVGRKRDRHTGKLDKGERRIPGTNTLIPWPVEGEESHTLHPDDTTADLISIETYQPTLLSDPMPRSIIDELRGKYSRYRTHFSWEERQRIEEKAARLEARKGLIDTMQTPLQELAKLRAQQKQEREKDLTQEQLAAIGQVIAQERAKLKSTSDAAAI